LRTAIVGWLLILGLFLLDGTVVVDKDKSTLILGVDVSSGTLVARAEVTLRVIVG
jgi:hypothetical protein